MLKYILAIIIFGVIIFIHEFGHFFVAKLCGIKVNKFALGMGPKILKKQIGETEYSLRLFPVGGFCAMEGEDQESENSRAFGNKPVWKRMFVIVAGAFMNILLGFVLIVILTCMRSAVPSTIVGGFSTQSETSEIITAQSYECGLREGDEIIKMDGMRIFTPSDLSYQLYSDDDGKFDIVVKRDGKKITLNDVIFHDSATDSVVDFQIKGLNKNPLNVLAFSGKDTVSTARMIWISLVDLVTGKYGFNDLSGPVGLVGAIGDAADAGETFRESFMTLINLTIFITINLGIFNLLPIPGLDGGRFLFLLIEAVRRKPVKPEHEGIVHLIGMALLMMLIVAVTFSDIQKLIG